MIAILAGLIAAPGAAQAAITSSNVFIPSASPTFLDPDLSGGGVPLNVQGTSTGTGNADIGCVYDNGQSSVPLATNVPATGGFNTNINQKNFRGDICRLIAVPTGQSPPYSLTTFTGPVVSNAGYDFDGYRVGPGPNAGALYDYIQHSSPLEGYWKVYSAGECYVASGIPLDPVSLTYSDELWSCSDFPQGTADPSVNLKVGGQKALLPYVATNTLAGFHGIESPSHSIETTFGNMNVADTETPMICVDTPTPCASYADSGLQLQQKQVGGTRGHTLEIEHRWVNATGTDKQLDFVYEVTSGSAGPGWRFPGQSAYIAHTADVVPVPGPGPASVFLAGAPGSSCADLAHACGSVTWSVAPGSISFASPDHLLLHYSTTVPANGSKTFKLTYSQGYPQSAVDGYAAAAEAAYTPPPPPSSEFSLGTAKLNKKKGTATIAVQVGAAGELTASGKNLKEFTKEVTAAGTVDVPVAAAGKGKKKLKKKGKLKVTVQITFNATGSTGSAQHTVKLTLKRKHKGHHK